MFDAKYVNDTEMQLRVHNLERFAQKNYPDREDLWPKSVYLGLLKMNPDWADGYLLETGNMKMLEDKNIAGTAFLAFEIWQHELQDYWRQERDPDGEIDRLIRSRCLEEIKRE